MTSEISHHAQEIAAAHSREKLELLARRHAVSPQASFKARGERQSLTGRLSLEKYDQCLRVALDQLDEERIVVGMDLAQRLRTQINAPVGRKTDLRARSCVRLRRAIAHANSRQAQ